MNQARDDEGTANPEAESTLPYPDSDRATVLRDMAVFQIKLFADGFKDLILSPLSLLAGIGGVLVGGRNPGVLLYPLLRAGQRVEDWISLFSAAYRSAGSESAADVDTEPDEAPSSRTSGAEASSTDFDALIDRLQRSMLDPATRETLSEHSRKKLEALAKRLRRDEA